MIAGRLLALALMTGTAAVAVHERRHPLPSEFRLTFGRPPQIEYRARYDASRRLLHVGYSPAADPGGEGLPVLSEPELLPLRDDPAQAAKDWLLSRPLRVPRSALELQLLRLKAEDIRPAWLPWVEPPAPKDPVTVEILNGSGRPGVASAAKKVLRLQGADVVDIGNSDTLETRTIVYDRTGRHENAQAVRRWLGCEAAAAVTRPDPKRLVDVTVLIADDCPMQ